MTSNEYQPGGGAGHDTVASETASETQRIDTALARIAGLDGRPLHEHVDAYQQLHGVLQAVLAGIDTA